MEFKKFSWLSTLYRFAMTFDDFRFLLSRFSEYKKNHCKVKSNERIAYYVLKSNYSTTVMYMMRYVNRDCFDKYIEFRKSFNI